MAQRGTLSDAAGDLVTLFPSLQGEGDLPGAIEPELLASWRSLVRDTVPGVTEALDRRGYPLLHWPPLYGGAKPTELSLEHEVRLSADDSSKAVALLSALKHSHGCQITDILLPGENSEEMALRVDAVQREPGPQSVDRYWDIEDPHEAFLMSRNLTFRERVKGSGFMTWTQGDSSENRPLNLELPFVPIGSSGLTVRLEFNWLGSPEHVFGGKNRCRHSDTAFSDPLVLAELAVGIEIPALVPVVEHTLVREKFTLTDADNRQAFALNIDLVRVRSLRSTATGMYVDVDLAPTLVVDAQCVMMLDRLGRVLKNEYRLHPTLRTKGFTDLQVLGLVGGEDSRS